MPWVPGGQELHAALGTAARLGAGDLGMHRAGVVIAGAAVASSFMPHLGNAPAPAGDLGMHGAGVGDRPPRPGHGRRVDLGDQGQDLVRLGGQPAVQLLTFGGQLRSPAELP